MKTENVQSKSFHVKAKKVFRDFPVRNEQNKCIPGSSHSTQKKRIFSK